MKDYTKYSGIYFAHSIENTSYSYMVIFGYHINGAFIAIPNWNICIEASDYPSNYNYNKLITAGLTPMSANTVSSYINTWLEDNSDYVNLLRTENQKKLDNYISNCINGNPPLCE